MSAFVDPVGASLPRLEAARQGRPAAPATLDDHARPGMLYAAVAQSPHAHARIRRLSMSPRRKALPGVKAIVTGADFRCARVGGVLKDETMLARRQGALCRRAGRRRRRERP